MKYVVTGMAYKVDDPNKQSELLFYRVDAIDPIDAELSFGMSIVVDGYELIKVISVVENEDN